MFSQLMMMFTNLKWQSIHVYNFSVNFLFCLDPNTNVMWELLFWSFRLPDYFLFFFFNLSGNIRFCYILDSKKKIFFFTSLNWHCAGFNLYIYLFIFVAFLCVLTKCILPWCNHHGWLDAKYQLSVYLLTENCVCLIFCCSDDSWPDEDCAWWKTVSVGFLLFKWLMIWWRLCSMKNCLFFVVVFVQMTHDMMKTVPHEKLSVVFLLFRWRMTWWRPCMIKKKLSRQNSASGSCI